MGKSYLDDTKLVGSSELLCSVLFELQKDKYLLAIGGGGLVLQELKGVRQIENEGVRRWFSDDYFHLIVWYKEFAEEFLGFQLCYDIYDNERSLTWKEDSGFSHNSIDDDKGFSHHPQAPILISDGNFDSIVISQKFLDSSNNIPKEITSFVANKISEYR